VAHVLCVNARQPIGQYRGLMVCGCLAARHVHEYHPSSYPSEARTEVSFCGSRGDISTDSHRLLTWADDVYGMDGFDVGAHDSINRASAVRKDAPLYALTTKAVGLNE